MKNSRKLDTFAQESDSRQSEQKPNRKSNIYALIATKHSARPSDQTSNPLDLNAQPANIHKFSFIRQLWGRVVGSRHKQQIAIATTLSVMAVLLIVGVDAVMARSLFATAPTLGSARSFAVLAGSTATNTGETTIVGNLGTSPGTAITGFPPGTITDGTIHGGDAVALLAQSDARIAYNALAGQPCDFNLTGQDMEGDTFTTGVYCYDTSAQLTGEMVIDGEGDPDAVFIFQIGSTLTTASDASLRLINQANVCNIYWQVGTSATLGTDTDLAGTILADQSITLNTDAALRGRALALVGAVTMDSNPISVSCPADLPTVTPGATTPPDSTSTPVATPPPGSTATPIGGNPPVPPIGTATPIGGNPPVPPIGTATPIGGNPPVPPIGTATPIVINPPVPPIGTATPTSTPGEPVGVGTPGAPTADEPVDQPSQFTSTLYMPIGIK